VGGERVEEGNGPAKGIVDPDPGHLTRVLAPLPGRDVREPLVVERDAVGARPASEHQELRRRGARPREQADAGVSGLGSQVDSHRHRGRGGGRHRGGPPVFFTAIIAGP
jgi:hypothetical protein